jgi:hypothetical protein
MVYPTTTNKSLEKPDHGTAVDVWDVPLNSDFNIIDKSFGGVVIFNATAGSQTLTSGISDAYSYIPLTIQVEGSISANVVYTIPSGVGGQWVVRNITTDGTGGPWTVSFVNAYSGLGVVIPRGYSSIINSDGAAVNFSDTRVPAAAGSDRQVQFNSGGYLGGSSAFTYDSSGNLNVGGNSVIGGGSTIAGNVGIGTLVPSQKLEVAGTIYSTSGGFKFPDNTTQTTAATSLIATAIGQVPFSTNGSTYTATQKIVQSTAQASTSGTTIDFTSIPSWVKRITVMFNQVSTNGSSGKLVQLGSSGVATSGYNSASGAIFSASGFSVLNSTAGFVINSTDPSDNLMGTMVINLVTGFTYVSSHSAADNSGSYYNSYCGGGVVTLSGAVDTVRITTVNGTDTFDAGTINILYE